MGLKILKDFLKAEGLMLRKDRRLTILLIVIIAALTTGMISVSAHSDKDNIKGNFYESVNYNPTKDLLSFTIPKNIPEGYKFYLHVSGRMFMGDKSNGMSFHAFDKESLSYTWKKGKTYTYPLNSDNLDFIMLDFGLMNKSNNKLKYEYEIHISSDGTKVIDRVN